jgi:L-iditol 2-dehydrogenase
MRALQLVQPRVFEMVDTPVPKLPGNGSGQLLIKTRWVSLCGSDIAFFNGNKRYIHYPMLIGAPIHESVGQVVESDSEKFHPGDTVLAIPELDRGLAEYFIAQDSKAIQLPADLALRDDSCLIQPLSTVLNAVNQLGELKGKSVAVIGLGSIGLFFCWLLKMRDAGYILGIDPNQQRCQVAEKLGADETISERSIEVNHASKRGKTLRQPPDICIEAVGHQTETINDCIDLVRYQGTVLSFGVPDQLVYPIEYETFFRKNAVLTAVVTPDWSDYLSRAGELFQAHTSELAWLVTHRMPIKDAAQAFSLYEQHADGILKVILDAAAWD